MGTRRQAPARTRHVARSVDTARVVKDHSRAKADTGGKTNYVKLKDGANVVRVLPPWSDECVPYKQAAFHYGVVQKRALACPKKMHGNDCPICDEVDRLFATGDKRDEEEARQFMSKWRVFYNVIDRSDEAAGVQVLGVGNSIHERVTSFFADPDYGDISNIDDGTDVVIDKTGSGFNTRYTTSCKRNATPLSDHDDDIDEWLDSLVDLDVIVKEYSYEDLEIAWADPEEFKRLDEDRTKLKDDDAPRRQREAPRRQPARRDSERAGSRRGGSESRESAPPLRRRSTPQRRTQPPEEDMQREGLRDEIDATVRERGARRRQ